ncbi:hypothetical protein M885DRAFT_543979 [Pelagophyceae sp. CCMP2097]|nr:hypothetical protein M885DRAFT_543979 [Pelagophyceae sp. CCMP2097]
MRKDGRLRCERGSRVTWAPAERTRCPERAHVGKRGPMGAERHRDERRGRSCGGPGSPLWTLDGPIQGASAIKPTSTITLVRPLKMAIPEGPSTAPNAPRKGHSSRDTLRPRDGPEAPSRRPAV